VAQRVVEEVPRTSWIRSGSAMTAGIDAGESEVEDHQVGFRLARHSDRRLGVASGSYVEAVLAQVALDDSHEARLVIDDQRAQLPRIHDQAASFAMNVPCHV
jgi:hypothetical protein